MTNPLNHRGITLIQSDHPSGAITWSHEATGSGGVAHTTQEAIRQISGQLGPDPDCRVCAGSGHEEYAEAASVACHICFPEEL
ncbi:hypothetical protein [Paracoccus sp. (in: a-proteobacteria)]|uniref:hypothetical protein n=1 Tax=Paracoccus sp. TaxID=267 RepID=UPI002896B23C|nr:hypothetical protein [Paracoccus sp. (in: a-proteobacteria)]